jgi:CMP-N,N'-diacetyllegionaminic acid synthase
MSMPSVVAIIPARAGSKGIPDKNIRPLGGHPLVGWTIAASRRASRVDRVIVSTDSPDYAKLSIAEGAEVPFLRPAGISGDGSTDYECMAHALDWLAARGEEPDYVVHMRPTSPLRDPRLVDEAVQAFMAAPGATALRSVHEMSESAYKTFEIAEGGQLKRVGSESTELDAANNARQRFPKTYSPNGYVDVLSTAFIRRTSLIHGNHVLPFITPPVVEIDTEDDFAHLEFQLPRMSNIVQRLFG